MQDRHVASVPHLHLPIMDAAGLQSRLGEVTLTAGEENHEARALVTLGSKNSTLLWGGCHCLGTRWSSMVAASPLWMKVRGSRFG